MNKSFILGNLGKDPEITTFQNGDRIATMSVATTEKYTDKNGEKQEAVEWHRVKFNGKLVDVIEKYLKKGDRVLVVGKIHYSKKENNGTTTYFTDILGKELTMLTPKGQSQGSAASGSVSDAEVIEDGNYPPF